MTSTLSAMQLRADNDENIPAPQRQQIGRTLRKHRVAFLNLQGEAQKAHDVKEKKGRVKAMKLPSIVDNSVVESDDVATPSTQRPSEAEEVRDEDVAEPLQNIDQSVQPISKPDPSINRKVNDASPEEQKPSRSVKIISNSWKLFQSLTSLKFRSHQVVPVSDSTEEAGSQFSNIG